MPAICFVVANSMIQAAPVIGGPQAFTVRADQQVTLAPGTLFNPGPTELPIGTVSATTTTFVFDRMMQVGSTIEFRNANFIGRGVVAGAGGVTLTQGPTEATARLLNTVQDMTHPGFAVGDPASICSGNLIFKVPNYRLEFDNGVNLEVRDPFVFVANFTDGLDQLDVVWQSSPLDNPLNAFLEVPMTSGRLAPIAR